MPLNTVYVMFFALGKGILASPIANGKLLVEDVSPSASY